MGFDDDSLRFNDLDKDVGVGITNAIKTAHNKLPFSLAMATEILARASLVFVHLSIPLAQ